MNPIEIDILPLGIHRSGNGIELNATSEMLDDVVATFNRDKFAPPLIVGHDTQGVSDAALHASEFAYGIPDKLKRVGNVVKAVFTDIAPEFRQWVEDKKLTSVSPSFYLPWSVNNPNPGHYTYRHLAGLGATPPAIKSLANALQRSFKGVNFSDADDDSISFSFKVKPGTTEFSCGCDPRGLESVLWSNLRDFMIEQFSLELADRVIPPDTLGILMDMERREDDRFSEIWQRLTRLEYPPSDNPTNYQEAKPMPEEELTLEFRESALQLQEAAIKKREEELAQRSRTLFEAESAQFCEGLKGKLTPAIATPEEVVKFMSYLNETGAGAPINFSDEKTEAPLDWFRGFLSRLPLSVQFGEFAKDSLVDVGSSKVSGTFDASEVEADRRIRAYQKQHDCSYAEAMQQLGINY